MRLALLTDLHANREALEACLAHAKAQQVEQYVILGDLIGYGPDPVWVLETVMDLVQGGAVVVLGNHDDALIHPCHLGLNPLAREVVDWSREQLHPPHLDFLQGLELTCVIDRRECRVVPDWNADAYSCLSLMHANAWAPRDWEYVDSPAKAEQSMDATLTRWSFCGHVHRPSLYCREQGASAMDVTPTPGSVIHLHPQHQWLVQPGSLGQPRDGNPDACYAVLDTVTLDLCYFRVPYDTYFTANKLIAAGLPVSLAQRLLFGGVRIPTLRA